MRCEVSRAQPWRRSASRTASAKPAPPGTTSSGWRSRARRVRRTARGSASAAAETAPDLDDRQHSRAASSVASAAAGPGPAAIDDSRYARVARRPRAPGTAPVPTTTTGGRGWHLTRHPGPPPRSAHLLVVQEAGDRRDRAASSWSTSERHQPRDAFAGELGRGRAAVGRRAVEASASRTAEDEAHVGADREGLRRHRAPAAPDRHARRDRGEVRAQRAGADELARQQPLEVVAPARRDAAGGDRDDIGGRAADVDQQRVGVDARDHERRAPSSWRRRRPAAACAPLHRNELAGRRQHAQRGRERPAAASSTNATPSRLVRNASESSAVIVIATARADRPRRRPRAAPRRAPRGRARSRTARRPQRHPSNRAAFVFAPPMSMLASTGVRVVGVIDLKGGAAVHAVRGERERYRPVTACSPLTAATR